MEAMTVKRILVGLDGSPDSTAALEWAVRMAKGMGSEVVAVFAVDLPVFYTTPYGDMMPPPLDPEWRKAMESEFETRWCQPLKAAGVRYRAITKGGRPATALNDTAEEIDADVIVVGRRGRGGFAELILGSVSHELVLHSKRPVLLIPPPTQVHVAEPES